MDADQRFVEFGGIELEATPCEEGKPMAWVAESEHYRVSVSKYLISGWVVEVTDTAQDKRVERVQVTKGDEPDDMANYVLEKYRSFF